MWKDQTQIRSSVGRERKQDSFLFFSEASRCILLTLGPSFCLPDMTVIFTKCFEALCTLPVSHQRRRMCRDWFVIKERPSRTGEAFVASLVLGSLSFLANDPKDVSRFIDTVGHLWYA